MLTINLGKCAFDSAYDGTGNIFESIAFDAKVNKLTFVYACFISSGEYKFR